jgi:hypothetical protein
VSNVLISSLEKDEYDRVVGLENASEIWETLRLFHEGSRSIHKAKVEMLEGCWDQIAEGNLISNIGEKSEGGVTCTRKQCVRRSQGHNTLGNKCTYFLP